MRYYLLNVTIASNGNEVRNFTPYDNLDTAERKFHEALVGIGAGSRRIAVTLMDYNLNEIKKEIWQQYFTVDFDVNGGVGAGTEDGDLPKAGGNNYVKFISTLKNLYASVKADNNIEETDKQKIVELVNQLINILVQY